MVAIPFNLVTISLVINPLAVVVAGSCVWLALALPAILFVIVVAKLASSPRAAANSFKVFNVSGALSTRAATLLSVYVLAVLRLVDIDSLIPVILV